MWSGNRQQQFKTRFNRGRQQGFVLILTLILLAVLTLIGVSSMNSSNTELRATANSRQHQIAFNVVQSVLEFSVSAGGGALIDFQINDPNRTQTVNSYSVTNGANLSASAVFAGCGIALGSSLEEGKGFSYNYFDITGSGTNTAGTATSVQVQGIRFPAASC